MISIGIPTPLRPFTGGRDEVCVEGATLLAAIEALDRLHPGMKGRLLNDHGALRPYVNVFVNDEDVRALDGLRTPLRPGDRLLLIPAIAGG